LRFNVWAGDSLEAVGIHIAADLDPSLLEVAVRVGVDHQQTDRVRVEAGQGRHPVLVPAAHLAGRPKTTSSSRTVSFPAQKNDKLPPPPNGWQIFVCALNRFFRPRRAMNYRHEISRFFDFEDGGCPPSGIFGCHLSINKISSYSSNQGGS